MYKIGTGSVGEYNSILRNYKVPVIPGAADTKAPAAVAPEQKGASRNDIHRKDAGLEDISLTFNRQEGFGYIGRDSDIHSLDVEKAIDDMKKDKVLQQYQYFVGSSRNLYEAGEGDGTVIRKL